MKVGVIADDLTGANATGVRLTKQGHRTLTVLNQEVYPEERYNALVLNTDSRYVEPFQASVKVKASYAYLSEWGAEIISKRIDSTFRGNIGVELDTILKTIPDSVAIIVPAFPDSKRTVCDGNLFVDGVPLEQTEVARDPVKPIQHANVCTLLEEQSQHATSTISLNDISGQSPDFLQALLKQKIEAGARMICCDAVSNRDIETIASAMASIQNHSLIPVDPGPLTSYYMQAKQQSRDTPVLLIVGSTTDHTSKQLEYLKTKVDVRTVYTDTNKLASFSECWGEEISRVAGVALEQFWHTDVVIITTNHPEQPPSCLNEQAQKEGRTMNDLGRRIAAGLGEIFTTMMESNHFDGNVGLFLSGGEVLASVCGSVKAQGIELIEEIQPLLAYGRLSGSQCDHLPIITKGGLAGDEKAAYESVQYLQAQLKKKEGDCYAR
ncbi:uncharacterized protein YgbK (DUF1537 family) [Geomicrobium halophilum]|uniref:Uncharacterized protein YgbK (DUF1537 family) n=1 Tax=Geomicrobium halophilum TaxID=549000 RepID=A0A841PME6_9BACL|nr:four-carbon acid sugar kinase family protein [Geomicrobium halophilum]MBB6449930.1 uncharacterized protein YgbK (DUF1537 family) [Geomicrobium halophilum]